MKPVLGFISIYRKEVRAFSDKQIVLLENFAAQAVIAMENARLIDEQREALEQQIATSEVLQVINASRGDLAPVFDTMLEKAMRLCGAAFGMLYTYDGERVHIAAHRGVPSAWAEFKARLPVMTPLPGSGLRRLYETKRSLHTLDMTTDEGYRAGIPNTRALVDLGGVRTLLSVPLIKDEAALGHITLYRQEVRAFSDKQIALLENFAAQAVIAMESARLLNELRARTDELAQRQAELRVTFENMGDGVAMFDEAQCLVAWNRKFQDILDLPDGILAQHLTFSDYIRYLAERGEYGRDTDAAEQVRRLTANLGQHRVLERTRPDGRVIEIRNNPVDGGGFVVIYADITERKRNEAEIAAARDAAQEATCTIEAAFRDLKTEPTLRLTTRGVGEQVEIRVRDNGTGISDAVRDKIFEPFFTTKPAGEGTGLGLSLSYDIVVKQHSGQLTVDSQTDSFTEFVITLPRKMTAGGGRAEDRA